MVNWASKWKKNGMGWFFESERHRRARLYGSAGGAGRSKSQRKFLQEHAYKMKDETIFAEDKKEGQKQGKDETKSKEEQFAEEYERLKKKKPKEKPFAEDIKPSQRESWVDQVEASVRGGKSVDFAINDLASTLAGKKDEGYQERFRKQQDTVRRVIGAGELVRLRRYERRWKGERREEFAKKYIPLYAQTDLKKGVEAVIPSYKSPRDKLMEFQDERRLAKAREQEQREKDAWARDVLTGGDIEHSPFDPHNRGVFDPLGNMGVDAEIHPFSEMFDFGQESSAPVKTETLADHTKFLVDDFFDSKQIFRENKIADHFYEGVDAFKKGDRAKLSDAIIDLGFEQRKLEDRKHILDMTRSKVLQDQNVVELMHDKEKGFGEGNFVLSGGLGGLFGGGSVGSQIADQTDKITKTESDIYKQIHKAKAMTQNLRQKLARLDADTDYSRFEPQAPVAIKNPYEEPKSSGIGMGGIKNPIASGGIKNPLFGSDKK
jgi:hypothetical protein